MRSRPALILALACGALVGCGSGSDSSADGPDPAGSMRPSVDVEFDRGPEDRRVRVVRVDADGDGTEDSSITYEYDGAGRIVSETEAFTDSGFSQVVTYQYEDGLLVTKGDGVETFTYVHDEDGRVVAIEEPFGDRTTFEYGGGGRLARFTGTGSDDDDDDAGPVDPLVPAPPAPLETVTVVYEGDLPARLEFDDGGSIRFGRDADGRLVSIEAGVEGFGVESLQTLTRDERGRVVGIDVVGELEQSVRPAYAQDRLASFVLSRPGGTVPFESRSELEYADDGLLDSVTTVIDLDPPTGARRITSVETYEYESPGCVVRSTKDPRTALIADAVGAPRASIAALECGYWLDDDF